MTVPQVETVLARALHRAGVSTFDLCERHAQALLNELAEQQQINGSQSYAAPLFPLLTGGLTPESIKAADGSDQTGQS